MVSSVAPVHQPGTVCMQHMPGGYAIYEAKDPIVLAVQENDANRLVAREPVDLEAEGHSAYVGSPRTFQVGELVRYWSDTHQTWMDGRVMRQMFDASGAIVSYDLDVKNGALPSKLQKHPSNLAPAQTPVAQQRYRVVHETPAPPQCVVQQAPLPQVYRACGDEGSRDCPDDTFDLGELLQYWSDTHKSWVDGRVMTRNLDSSGMVLSYDLDVRGGALPSKLRKHSNNVAYSYAPMPQNNQLVVQARAPTPECAVPRAFSRQTSPQDSPDVTFNVGELVDYWSETHRSWVEGRVMKQNRDSFGALLSYDLDVKAAALPSRMRYQCHIVNSQLPTPVEAPVEAPSQLPRPVVVRRNVVNSQLPKPHELGQPLAMDELQIGSGPFNPCDPHVLSQLQSKLGFATNAGVEELQGFTGGLNEGVWFLGSGACAPHEELVLKLVKCTSIAPSIPTESENFQKIFREHPSIVSDAAVAFPRKIFSCRGASGECRYDLICMRKMKGLRLAEVTADKWHKDKKSELMTIFRQTGACIAEFHRRYGGFHHGDLQPSNVFYDEEAKQVTMIDVGGMTKTFVETDQAHFTKSLELFSSHYGPSFATDGICAFDAGYAAGAAKPF